MDILFLLVPMSVVLALIVVAVFGWALNAGQLDDIEQEGAFILQDDGTDERPVRVLDLDQAAHATRVAASACLTRGKP